MSVAIVIPARMASTRFPGKPLVDLGGKPMLQWVFEAAVSSQVTDTVIVATPDSEIAEACAAFGAPVVMTSNDHVSGTDRIAEVAQGLVADVYVNVQGDEPFFDHRSLRACSDLACKPDVAMASVRCPCPESDVENPNVVKVVCDKQGRALYFSRFPIPFPRNPRSCPVWKHIGIYGYRRDVLLSFPNWRRGQLEDTESLEQLRFLENGVAVWMAEGVEGGPGIDTPEQAEQARRTLSERREQPL